MQPETLRDFNVNDYRFEFVLENNAISKIMISFPITKDELPSISQSDLPGSPPNITTTSPRWEQLSIMVKQIENTWAIWGLERIQWRNHKIEWIPENDDEKNLIVLSSFEVKPTSGSNYSKQKTGFDLLARPIISAVKSPNYDPTLAFIRRGTNDIRVGDYIEAFYDFYFALESKFGNGKTKNYQIEKELLKSLALKRIISKQINDEKYVLSLPTELRKKFKEKYFGISAEQFIKKIVNLRGFLHHHNPKHKDSWDPNDQEPYKLEAFVLQDISLPLAMSCIKNNVFTEEMENKYYEVIKSGSTNVSP